uniref:Pyrin domain-containing protein n=1 Tax=Echeneis naucrates TaxID=173247 RepID=A0A665U2G8_ECHNA
QIQRCDELKSDILDDLTEEEFKRFKWYLGKTTVDNIVPIKVMELSKAEREEVVDLMVHKVLLQKISRNDLLQGLLQHQNLQPSV